MEEEGQNDNSIPRKTFLKELNDRKENKGARPEFPTLLTVGNKEHLHQHYFPYNRQLTRAILKDKHVMFIGDSLIRAMYKDMVTLIQTGEICTPYDLRVSNEDTFMEDKHIDMLELTANRVFRQAREFQSNRHLIQYFFTNRAMREDLEKTCLMMEAVDEKPDVVVINSAIWDVSRYPARHFRREFNDLEDLEEEINVVEEYFNRIAMLCRRLRVLLPPTSTVIWVLMPPSSAPDEDTKGKGFLDCNHLYFDEIRMRLLTANVRAAQIVREAGFDVLDISFHMRLSNYQVFRIKDGVHWNVVATRFMNQLLLGHIVQAWDIGERVAKKWPTGMWENACRKEQRSHYFEYAMTFLRNQNEFKHTNEGMHQIVRAISMSNFDVEMGPNGATLEHFMHYGRVLLMFYKYHNSTEDTSRSLQTAFNSLPEELLKFSQEELHRLNQMVFDFEWRYKGDLVGNVMSFSHKRLKKTLIEARPWDDPLATVSRIAPAVPLKKTRYD